MDQITADILIALVLLISGTLMLYFGAEGLVTGSSSLAVRIGITPLIVGLTVVSFGTSSPELVVSVSAAFKGNPSIALGNVIGSNICNIALILGIAALIRPIKIDLKLIKTDIWLMIVITALFLVLVADMKISRVDGAILFAGVIIYNYFTFYLAKKVRNKKTQELYEQGVPHKIRNPWLDFLFIIGGLGILILGANLFLEGAIDIAKFLGASEGLIGLSIVALGTSLPELATSMVASIKKEADISIGNAIGSNIFNILLILGTAALITPIIAQDIGIVDIGVMTFLAVLLFPFAWTKLTLSRLEGLFLLLIYIGYITYLYMQLPSN